MLQKQMVWEDGRTVQMLEYFAFGFQVYMQYCGICIRYNIPFSFKWYPFKHHDLLMTMCFGRCLKRDRIENSKAFKHFAHVLYDNR